MAGKAKPHGPTSKRLAANLRRIRQGQKMTTAELARRLTELGQPIQDTGITKIETGDRRVDVDDLVALALALDVSPNALLLPEVQYVPSLTDGAAALTPNVESPTLDLWAWATGERPLGQKAVTSADSEATRAAEWSFIVHNRPHHLASASYLQRLSDANLLDGVRARVPAVIGNGVIAAFNTGVTTGDIRDIFETALISATGTRIDQFSEETQEILNTIIQALKSEQAPDERL